MSDTVKRQLSGALALSIILLCMPVEFLVGTALLSNHVEAKHPARERPIQTANQSSGPVVVAFLFCLDARVVARFGVTMTTLAWSL